jgi:histidinol-phosphate aminotransferase
VAAGVDRLVAAEPKTLGSATKIVIAQSTNIARLNYNENPFGPSLPAAQALLALGDRMWKYSYEEVPVLRSLLATHEGVPPENVFVSEGSGEILKLAALIYADPHRQIIATHPTFPMLPQYAAQRGAAIAWVNVTATFGHDFAALRARVRKETSLLYICNPNNPTGVLSDPNELRGFIQALPPEVLVVVDEAYLDFAAQPEKATMIDQVKSGRNVLVTRSFSKIYGLAGLRVGYGIASPSIIRRLEAARTSIPNQAGIAAACASIGDTVFCASTREKIAQSRLYSSRIFDELSLRYVPSQTNFMMFDTGVENFTFLGFARQRGVLVAEVADPFSTWARVSMGRPEDMQRFAQTLRAFVHRT